MCALKDQQPTREERHQLKDAETAVPDLPCIAITEHWVRHGLLGPIRIVWFSRSAPGWRICISNRFPGDTNAAGMEIMFLRTIDKHRIVIFPKCWSEKVCGINELITGGFDLVRDCFPKQMAFELRSEFILEKMSEKSKENSRHWKLHVQRKRERTGDWKEVWVAWSGENGGDTQDRVFRGGGGQLVQVLVSLPQLHLIL